MNPNLSENLKEQCSRLKIPVFCAGKHLYNNSFMVLHARSYHPQGCFMPNKPNLQKAKINVTSVKTNYYENNRLRGHCETNPNKPSFKPNFKAKTPLLTKTNPIQSQNKPNPIATIYDTIMSIRLSNGRTKNSKGLCRFNQHRPCKLQIID